MRVLADHGREREARVGEDGPRALAGRHAVGAVVAVGPAGLAAPEAAAHAAAGQCDRVDGDDGAAAAAREEAAVLAARVAGRAEGRARVPEVIGYRGRRHLLSLGYCFRRPTHTAHCGKNETEIVSIAYLLKLGFYRRKRRNRPL